MFRRARGRYASVTGDAPPLRGGSLADTRSRKRFPTAGFQQSPVVRTGGFPEARDNPGRFARARRPPKTRSPVDDARVRRWIQAWRARDRPLPPPPPPPPSPPRTARAHPRRRARPSRRPTLRPTSSRARQTSPPSPPTRSRSTPIPPRAARALEPTRWSPRSGVTPSPPPSTSRPTAARGDADEGGATLPVDVGPVRSAAAWDGDVALGTAQAPGVVVAAGALTPGVVDVAAGRTCWPRRRRARGQPFSSPRGPRRAWWSSSKRTSAPGDSSDAARSRCRSGWTTSGPRRPGRTRPRERAGLSSPRTRRRRWWRRFATTTSRSRPRRWRKARSSCARGRRYVPSIARVESPSPRLFVLIQRSYRAGTRRRQQLLDHAHVAV